MRQSTQMNTIVTIAYNVFGIRSVTAKNEWARDDDRDGIREVHVNSNEGGWTSMRNFLRPYRGVHKAYLTGYAAIHELAVNYKRISPDLVSKLVRSHSF